MRSLLLLTAASLLCAGAANAETFTFTGSSQSGMQVAAPGPGGKPVVGVTAKIETNIVWASGAKEKSTGDCVGWSAPPGTAASNLGVCNSTSGNGDKSALFFTCITTNEQNTESDCWGRVVYTSGKNQGKSSTVSWHGKQNADGKGGTAVGAGNMN
jgi:hypothetical protein